METAPLSGDIVTHDTGLCYPHASGVVSTVGNGKGAGSERRAEDDRGRC